MQTVNWSQPQRQPAAGLLITVLHTLGKLLKQLWPVLVLMLVKGKMARAHWYEIIGGAILLLSVVGSVWRFFYFRFYIEEDKLIVKSGGLKKVTKVIPLANIQSVEITQGPVHQVFSLVRLSIDTAGSQKAEAVIEALRKPMAEALREQLLQGRNSLTEAAPQTAEKEKPVIQLTDKDLLKLSVSANHLKAFFIFFVFVGSLIDTFIDDEETVLPDWIAFAPGGSFSSYMFLVAAVLLIIILVSSADIFLRFHEFSVFKKQNGFYITSGLFQVKEKVLAMQKVQFISWQASWLRKKLGLWMLEYHIAGSGDIDPKTKVRVPVTNTHHLPLLLKGYRPVPQVIDKASIRIHPAYIFYRFVWVGLLPAVLALPLLWKSGVLSMFLLPVYLVVVLLTFWLRQRKFRLWAMDDVLYLKRGSWGEETFLLQWHMLQFIELRQSVYQRKKGLATVDIYTAGGFIRLPYIPLEAARQLINFALFKTESSREGWQ